MKRGTTGHPKFTHEQLVRRAASWLSSAACHQPVITELASIAGETPDVMGWSFGGSTLIECKTSVTDFRFDKVKRFRAFPELGMGLHRYYFVPERMITVDDLPDRWGLLYALENGRVEIVKQPEGHPERNINAENQLLVSALRRLHKNLGRIPFNEYLRVRLEEQPA